MSEPTKVIQVTHEEFERFINDQTFMPECAELDDSGVPTCGGKCPQGFVCATFNYTDLEHGNDMFWYACAKPEVVEKLSDRAILIDMAQPHRRVKYVTYSGSD